MPQIVNRRPTTRRGATAPNPSASRVMASTLCRPAAQRRSRVAAWSTAPSAATREAPPWRRSCCREAQAAALEINPLPPQATGLVFRQPVTISRRTAVCGHAVRLRSASIGGDACREASDLALGQEAFLCGANFSKLYTFGRVRGNSLRSAAKPASRRARQASAQQCRAHRSTMARPSLPRLDVGLLLPAATSTWNFATSAARARLADLSAKQRLYVPLDVRGSVPSCSPSCSASRPGLPEGRSRRVR